MLNSTNSFIYVFHHILTKKDKYNIFFDNLQESYFHNPLHQKFFSHLKELHSLDLDFSEEIFGISNDCEDFIASIKNLVSEYTSDYVFDFFIEQHKVYILNKTTQELHRKDISLVDKENKLKDALENLSLNKKKTELSTSKVSVDKYREYLYDIKDKNTDGGLIGISTGISALDEKTKGVKEQDFIVIGARPSQGKTALVLKIFREALYKNINPVFFSLEMQKEQLISRLLTQLNTSLGMEETMYAKNFDENIENIEQLLKYLEEKTFFIEDFIDNEGTKANITVGDLRAKAKDIKKQLKDEKIGLFIIDYLQLLSPETIRKGMSTNDIMSDISKGVKNLGRMYKCPVIALSQLNRELEKRQDKRPQLSDLRDSGAIEQDADIIMFIYRPAVYLEKEYREQLKKRPDDANLLRELNILENQTITDAEIIVGKQRNGPIGIVNASFYKNCSMFGDVGEFEENLFED